MIDGKAGIAFRERWNMDYRKRDAATRIHLMRYARMIYDSGMTCAGDRETVKTLLAVVAMHTPRKDIRRLETGRIARAIGATFPR